MQSPGGHSRQPASGDLRKGRAVLWSLDGSSHSLYSRGVGSPSCVLESQLHHLVLCHILRCEADRDLLLKLTGTSILSSVLLTWVPFGPHLGALSSGLGHLPSTFGVFLTLGGQVPCPSTPFLPPSPCFFQGPPPAPHSLRPVRKKGPSSPLY